MIIKIRINKGLKASIKGSKAILFMDDRIRDCHQLTRLTLNIKYRYLFMNVLLFRWLKIARFVDSQAVQKKTKNISSKVGCG